MSAHGAPGEGAPDHFPMEVYEDEAAQQTPQPTQTGASYHTSSTFLPPLTTSPPPHPPPYVPPAQHAMAPDPIHSLSLSGSMNQQGSAWAPGWRPGPPAPSPAYQQAYLRSGPNGQASHQLPPNPVEAYGPGSRQSMSSTPGPPAPLSTSNGSHGRTGSQAGESRDRKKERHPDENRERDEEEVISTIFVVGFPDDLSEREFQNIFTFAPGFEAATLKFPSGSTRREPAATAALLTELQHLAASQGISGSIFNPDHPDQTLDEALLALNFGTQSSSSSNTPSAAISLTPSAPSGATLGGAIPVSAPARRQTIGFARFKSRADALSARDHLQGRRIDSLTGATLKAEMAKKNLHTKRGVGGEDLVGLLLRSGRLSQLVSQQAQAQALTGSGGLGTPNSASMQQPAGLNVMLPPGQYPQAAQSAREAWDSWPVPGYAESKSDKPPFGSQQPIGSSQSNNSGSPPLSIKSPNTRPTDSKALLALAEEADELEGWSVGSVGMGIGLDYSSGSGSGAARSVVAPISVGQALSAPPASSVQQHPYGAYGQHSAYGAGLGGIGYGGQQEVLDTRSLGIGGNMNPADQNPPINTLYIGNLPAISPPTHPPNFLEESLRALFHRRPGFKRMSFRQKINGPMCFVEFEDIPFATLAMRELYGNTLNGLVKGGIRLSYSKNSLGQRGNSHAQGVNPSMFGGIAHTVALAGMSSPPSSNTLGPATGQGYLPPQSAPVPIGAPPIMSQQMSSSAPGADPRRPSDATSSLSPTALPFNAPLPTSPHQQRFYSNDTRSSAIGSGMQPTQPSAIPTTGKPDSSNSFNSFGPSSGSQGGGFSSPLSSPIRTPALLGGWVSSSAGGGASGTFGAFDAFANPHGVGLGSLNGAASAWGHANSPNASA